MNGIIIDNFAGGGGASLGIERAVRRPIDYAVNHDPQAIAMHKANHPHTFHYCEDVWDVDPREVADGRPVDLMWASPDCKHFSRAKGGKPVDKDIRGLAWVATRYAATVKPEVIFLENVREFREWGPLNEDGIPISDKKGRTFQNWIKEFERLGYSVDYRNLIACDYGAPTSRLRLFLVARRDGKSIVWPEPTHGTEDMPYRTAAECIDWSIPCPSIFSRKRPLVENTMRRIAKGLQRFVFDTGDPFIIHLTHHGSDRVNDINEPLKTITAAHRGEQALVTAFLTRHFGMSVGQSPDQPAPTITPGGGGKTGLVTAFITRYFGKSVGCRPEGPAPTVESRSKTGIVTSHLIKLWGTCRHGQDMREPMPTVTGGGYHLGEVRAFLIKYYGTATGQSLKEPAHTITSRDRLGLVMIAGDCYQVVDIGMRMLTPGELFLAQGFPGDYIIDPEYNGKPLTKTAQVKMVGNSVSPHPAEALVRANMNGNK